MSNLNGQTQAALFGEFNTVIEDGKMIVTPSEAGIQLLEYVVMSEQHLARASLEAETAQNTIESLKQDNASLRDLLEKVYVVLSMTEHNDLAGDILDKLYPITRTLEDWATEEYGEN